MTAEQTVRQAPPRARTVSPGRPPNAEVAERERQLLNVASAEFVCHGFGEANVARIARDAGVSKKTIYARYPSKSDLLIAVVSDLATRYYDRVKAVMSATAGDPEHFLTSFGSQAARNWATPEAVGVYRLVVAGAVRFPELAVIYRNTMDRFRSTLADYLRDQSIAGTLEIADADAASHQFGMLVYGEIREKALLCETVTDDDIDAVVRRAVRVFLTGYATRA